MSEALDKHSKETLTFFLRGVPSLFGKMPPDSSDSIGSRRNKSWLAWNALHSVQDGY